MNWDDDSGQAYIATSVALSALLVGMFAIPLVTYESTGGFAPTIAPFSSEAEDVMRVIPLIFDTVAVTVEVQCAAPDPVTGEPKCQLSPNSPCSEELIAEEIRETAAAVQGLVTSALDLQYADQPCSNAGGNDWQTPDSEFQVTLVMTNGAGVFRAPLPPIVAETTVNCHGNQESCDLLLASS